MGCLHSGAGAVLGREEVAESAAGRSSPPAHLPLPEDSDSSNQDLTRTPVLPHQVFFLLLAWNLHHPWTRLEDRERQRAECLVKLQDDPPDPTAARGWAVGC